MKVLVVTNLYPTPKHIYSGVFVKDQVEALRELGISVDVLFINGSANKLNYLKGLVEFWRRITFNKYDIIHAHYVHSGWIARMQFKLPIVVTSHGSDTLGREGWMLKKLFPYVDAVTITSKQNQDRVDLQDTYLLPCGVDTDIFQLQDKEEARTILGWDLHRKVMLYVGRETPLKRVDIIRDAYDISKKNFDNVDLVIASDLPHDQIPLCMNAADVFVFASETEGAPVVIKEAMACGLPIVSVEVGDVKEVIENTDGCYLCQRNPESMARYVCQVLNNTKRTNGREVAQQYSILAMANKLIDIYKRVIHIA